MPWRPVLPTLPSRLLLPMAMRRTRVRTQYETCRLPAQLAAAVDASAGSMAQATILQPLRLTPGPGVRAQLEIQCTLVGVTVRPLPTRSTSDPRLAAHVLPTQGTIHRISLGSNLKTDK